MSITSTGLGDFKKGAGAGDGAADADLGALTIKEFAELFRTSRGTVYNEVKAGKLSIAKVGARAIITRGEARRYQRALDEAAS